jgi:hypothetical protein
MATANDIITRAMKSLGTLGRTEVPSAQEASDGLTGFNALLDSWTNERLMSYVTLQRSFPLVVGQQSYTIGSGGNINTSRPTDIIKAFIRDSNNLDYGMKIVPFDVWDDIGNKTITSQIPQILYYSSAYPLGTIWIFPIPLLTYSVYYESTTQQVLMTDLTTTISLPPGYERCFVMNLALEMMSMGYPCLLDEKQLSALVNSASESKANIKRMNIKENIAKYDEAVVSRSYATYNIYRDGPN